MGIYFILCVNIRYLIIRLGRSHNLLHFLELKYYGSVSHELGHLAKNAFLKQVNRKKDLTADNPTDYIENKRSH